MKNVACSLVLMISVSSLADAALIPPFDPGFSATKATDVIVASEGERIDGILDVLDTWKGDLEKGQIIRVPELALFRSEEARTIEGWWSDRSFGSVTGNRMVLFLVKSLALSDDQEESAVDKESTRTIRWLPASYPDYRPVFAGGMEPRDNVARMRISVAWVESGLIYAFRQTVNPGPLRLVKLQGMTEEELKALVLEKSKNCGDFDKAAASPDPQERVNAILPFTKADEHRTREKAFNALGECGIAALPHLRQILGDEQSLHRHYLAAKAVAKAGGLSAGQEIASLLRSELEYLRERDDEIKGTAWNSLPPDVRLHILKLQEGLKAVDWLQYGDAKDVVSDIKHWLGDHQRAYGLASACNAYLAQHDWITHRNLATETGLTIR